MAGGQDEALARSAAKIDHQGLPQFGFAAAETTDFLKKYRPSAAFLSGGR
jgi:hypothetical protein